jgi:hypothetical protein
MRSKDHSEENAAGIFRMARYYQIAADRLLTIMKAGEKLPLRDPTYFLYAHSVELALKALLLANDLPIPTSREKGHDIGEIFVRCRDEKLIGPDPNLELNQLVVLLGAGNERQRYRYAGKLTRIRPDLDWVSEGVGRLMQIVEPHVTAWTKGNSPPPSDHSITFGKPTVTKQPIPTKPGP